MKRSLILITALVTAACGSHEVGEPTSQLAATQPQAASDSAAMQDAMGVFLRYTDINNLLYGLETSFLKKPIAGGIYQPPIRGTVPVKPLFGYGFTATEIHYRIPRVNYEVQIENLGLERIGSQAGEPLLKLTAGVRIKHLGIPLLNLNPEGTWFCHDWNLASVDKVIPFNMIVRSVRAPEGHAKLEAIEPVKVDLNEANFYFAAPETCDYWSNWYGLRHFLRLIVNSKRDLIAEKLGASVRGAVNKSLAELFGHISLDRVDWAKDRGESIMEVVGGVSLKPQELMLLEQGIYGLFSASDREALGPYVDDASRIEATHSTEFSFVKLSEKLFNGLLWRATKLEKLEHALTSSDPERGHLIAMGSLEKVFPGLSKKYDDSAEAAVKLHVKEAPVLGLEQSVVLGQHIQGIDFGLVVPSVAADLSVAGEPIYGLEASAMVEMRLVGRANDDYSTDVVLAVDDVLIGQFSGQSRAPQGPKFISAAGLAELSKDFVRLAPKGPSTGADPANATDDAPTAAPQEPKFDPETFGLTALKTIPVGTIPAIELGETRLVFGGVSINQGVVLRMHIDRMASQSGE